MGIDDLFQAVNVVLYDQLALLKLVALYVCDVDDFVCVCLFGDTVDFSS